MDASGPDLGRHGGQAWGELILDVEVPLRDVIALGAGIRIRRAQFIRRERWLNSVKKRTISRLIDRGILKERSRLGHQKNELIGKRQDIEQPGTAAYGHFSIVERVPGKTYARLKVLRGGVAVEKGVTKMGVSVRKISQVGKLAMNLRR